MMHKKAFAHWCSKPKNWPPRGLDEQQANAEFEARAVDPDVVTDEDGPSENFRLQIGVKIRKVLIEREAIIKEQGFELADRL